MNCQEDPEKPGRYLVILMNQVIGKVSGIRYYGRIVSYKPSRDDQWFSPVIMSAAKREIRLWFTEKGINGDAVRIVWD